MQDEHEVPLERDEESAGGASALSREGSMDLLFRTRLRTLKLRPPIAVSRSASVAEACARMRDARIGCVLVMDGERLVGIFTERDVLYKVAGTDLDTKTTTIDALMTPRPTTLKSGHRLSDALNKMVADGCRHIPVVDDAGRPLGVVSVRRIVDFLVEQFPRALLNLPPDPDQAMATVEGG